MMKHFSVDALNFLPFALAFDKMIKMCLAVSLFGFIILEAYLTSWIHRFIYFTKFWKFLAILLLFFNKDFLMWIIFKGYLICYNIASVLWGFLVLFFGWEACGILAAWSGIEPSLSASEGEVLTTRPTGKLPFFFKIFIFYSFALSFLRFPLNGCWYTWLNSICLFSSVQFSCSVMSDSLRPHGLQHDRPPCPSPTPRA